MRASTFASVCAEERPAKPPPMITIRFIVPSSCASRSDASGLTPPNKLFPKQRKPNHSTIRTSPKLHCLVNILDRIDRAEGVVVLVDERDRQPLPVQCQRVVRDADRR